MLMTLGLRPIVLGWCFVLALFLLPVVSRAQGDASDSDTKPSSGEADSSSNDTHTLVNKETQKAVRKVKKIRVKVLLEDPFVMRRDPFVTNQGHSDFQGLFIDVLDDVTRRANLTYEVSLQADHSYGHEYSPGNWTGLIGSVQNGEADLAVAPLSIVSNRQKVVDFTLPVMSAGFRIVYKVPDSWSAGESFSILLSPFTAGVWFLLLLTFLGVSLLFYVIGRFSPYEDTAFVGKAATYEGLTFLNSFLYSFSSMTFQGYTAAPRSISGRLLAAFWWIYVLLVIAAYSASLCAIFLAFKPSINKVPFATFDELSKQTSVAYGVVKGGSTQWFLNNSRQPLQRRLWSTIAAHGDNLLVNNVNEGLLRVHKSDGDFAFITEGPVAEYLSGLPPCQLMTLGEELGEHAYGFACAKDTDVCTNLNTAILQMQEEDFVYEVKQKWLHKGCNRDDTSEYIFQGLAYFDTFGTEPTYLADRTVTLRRFSTGFLVLFVGVLLSMAFLLGEIFYARRRGTSVPQRMPRGMEDQERIDREYRDDEA